MSSKAMFVFYAKFCNCCTAESDVANVDWRPPCQLCVRDDGHYDDQVT